MEREIHPFEKETHIQHPLIFEFHVRLFAEAQKKPAAPLSSNRQQQKSDFLDTLHR